MGKGKSGKSVPAFRPFNVPQKKSIALPTRVASWQDGRNAGRAEMISLFLFLWKDKFGASDDDIERMGKCLHSYLEEVIAGQVSMMDVMETMKDEYGWLTELK